MTHTYHLEGIYCNNCVAKIKSELLKLGDVLSAEVQPDPPQAILSMAKHIPVSELQAAVSKAGNYTIKEPGEMPLATSRVEEENSYFPVFLIFGFITGITLIIQLTKSSFSWMQWMSHFMAGFFIVFSFFKLMNIKGFAEGYSSYDVVTKRFPLWGFIYPFVELGLGLAFLTEFEPFIISLITLVIMGVSVTGVIQSLLKKSKFQCACLGTVIKLPLGKVTLLEDLLMIVMSGLMIILL